MGKSVQLCGAASVEAGARNCSVVVIGRLN